ncbi:MAG TPA: hypothetical protein VFO79_10615, partial [Xanthomonadales bacterium]|nr:hypothetical protein [Xanthomonadales bacterium]
SAAESAPQAGLVEDIGRVLTPSTAAEERTALFARLDAAAQAGDPSAAYLIGSLYRRGADLSGLQLAKNPGRALKWLHAAALGGELNAFAKLAETYADIGEPLEAMAWAQAYAYFLERDPSCRKECGDGYTAALLKRLYAELPADAEEQITKRSREVLLKVGPSFEYARLRHAQEAGQRKPSYAGSRRKVDFVDRSESRPMPPAGIAEFVVRVDADGAIRDAWVLDSLPRADLAAELRATLLTMKLEAGAGDRYAIVPLVFDDRRLSVRK